MSVTSPPNQHQAVGSVLENDWRSAKKFGNIALYLSIGNLVYTLTITEVIVGLALGLPRQ